MPVHLPQLNRRQFLRRAALLGLTTALTPRAFAQLAAKPRDPDTVFLLSDTHIAADPRTVSHGVNMTDHLAAVVKQMLAWPVKPAAVIVTGDLAFHAGSDADYAAFGQIILPLRALAPIHLLLGNHDHRQRFWDAFPADATRDGLADRQAAVVSAGRTDWILLDSLEFTAHRPGLIGPEQLTWLTREIEARPHRSSLVFCHHHLDPVVENATLHGNLHLVPLIRDLGILGGLKDTPALVSLLTHHPAVKAFIYGHTHDWKTARHYHDLQLVNLPPTAYVFEYGRPSGWVRATFSDRGAELELRALDPKHPQHGQLKRLVWRA